MRALHTPLCDVLGIRYPILNAGIGLAAGPELAAAVTIAGGFGVLGGGGMPHEAMRIRVAQTRALTNGPFGINVIVDDPAAPEDLDHVEGIVAMGPAAIVLFWGDPTPYVPMAHHHDVKVLVQVGSLDEARRAAKAGADAVFAQGVEAGGHVRGTTPIWELLPDTVRALKPLPVLASGGIADGAGLARAIEFGAQGVSLGTRFVACDETWLHPAYNWPDAPHRTLKNKAFAEWVAAGRPPRGSKPGEGTSIGMRSNSMGERVEWMRYAIGTAPPDFDGDIEYAPLWAGESCSVVNDIKPAAQIIDDLVREAEAELGG